jgi:glycosyltransferase involved in cell wall biosynthesis
LPRLPEPPLISLVTPSFNQARFLERTLRSVLDQDYPRLQYIVQDGGSTDETIDVLERFQDRLARWESARDRGQSHALNLGFGHASGDVLAYLNSDDLLLPGSLHYVAHFFSTHPQVDVVYGHRIVIDAADREIGRWVLPPHDNDVLSWADFVPQETLFWRRSIWEKVGGWIDEDFHFAMDWDLLLRLREAGACFARVPRFLAAFRVHEEQKTSARIADVGIKEMDRLRQRCLGRPVSGAEIAARTRPFLRKHLLFHKLYRLGVLGY